MIGNDVIDLALARTESNWQRRGYLQKLFTENVRQLIQNALDSEIMVWNLWSRKEAAYKIYHRETKIRAFIPLRLECVFDSDFDGKVIVADRFYFTKTALSEGNIHTIAVGQKADFSKITFFDDRYNVYKKDGIPYVRNSTDPISISHHGRFEKIVALNDYKPNLNLSFRKSSAMV